MSGTQASFTSPTVPFPVTVYPLPVAYPVLTIPTNIDYTSKDYSGFLTSMLTFASQIMPDWNPTSEGDFGRVLVELFCYAADILSYYGDRISQEAYLPTAQQRLSLLNIAQLLGYTPSNGVPASGTVTFQTSNPGVAVDIPAGTQVQTSFGANGLDQPVVYETQADILVPANGGTNTVAVIQGETETLVELGVSDGTAGQQFTIPQTGVIDGSVSIFVQTATGNEEWTGVQHLVDSESTDKTYTIITDALGNTIITFGDNINGEIPGIGLAIFATYRIGVGAKGNVGVGLVGIIVDNIEGVFIPTQADGTTFLSSAMQGGTDPETNDQIRANAPAAFRTQYRAVSPADYGDLALAVPGVIAANAVANHSTSVSVYILGPGATVPDSTLIQSVLTYFESRMLAGVTLSVLPPNLIKVDVGSSGNKIQLAVKDRFAQANVIPNVQKALNSLLSPPNVGFGQLLNVSDIYNAILSVDGVAWALIPLFTREDVVKTDNTAIQFRASEVPIPGTFYINASGGFV